MGGVGSAAACWGLAVVEQCVNLSVSALNVEAATGGS